MASRTPKTKPVEALSGETRPITTPELPTRQPTIPHGDGFTDDEVITMWGLVVEGYTAMNSRITAHLDEIFAMPGSWFEVMLRLHRTPEHRLPMTQLASEVSFSSGGFTKLADRMESALLLERCACPNDRRVTWIALTDRGTSMIVDAMAQHAEWLRTNVVAHLGLDNTRALSEAMRSLRDRSRRTDNA